MNHDLSGAYSDEKQERAEQLDMPALGAGVSSGRRHSRGKTLAQDCRYRSKGALAR